MGVGCMILFSCFSFRVVAPSNVGRGDNFYSIPCRQEVKSTGFDPVNIGSNPIAVILNDNLVI